jgi:hypothetical protein
VPARAFVQAYGYFPWRRNKLDYALYVGNGPNANSDPDKGQTGIDTTTTLLVGGRIGIRRDELKAGLSFTFSKDNQFQPLAADIGISPQDHRQRPKFRTGGDLSHRIGAWSIESEFIRIRITDEITEIDVNAHFYYATLGYDYNEALFIYGSYWLANTHFAYDGPLAGHIENEDIYVPNCGVAYQLTYQLRFKAQYARVRGDEEHRVPGVEDVRLEPDNFTIYAIAISAIF